MGKIVENLTTLYRVLLLVSAIVLTTGAYYQPIVYRFSLGLARVERIDRMYKEFVGDIQADATAFYRAQLLAVFNNQPEWLKSVIARMRFAPAVVTWPAADRQSRRISLYSPDMWISLIFDMAANRQATMSYTEASLNSAQFAKYLSDVHELPNWRSILDTEDLVTTVEIGRSRANAPSGSSLTHGSNRTAPIYAPRWGARYCRSATSRIFGNRLHKRSPKHGAQVGSHYRRNCFSCR